MIVIPRLLADLLREVDQEAGSALSLMFAERVVRLCNEVLTPEEFDASMSYTGSARDLLEGRGGIEELVAVRNVFFSIRHGNTKFSDEVTWAADEAVMACYGLELIKSRAVAVKVSSLPSVADVAKRAQQVAGQYAIMTAASEDEGNRREAAGQARWLEARWQLVQLIEFLPVPLGSYSPQQR